MGLFAADRTLTQMVGPVSDAKALGLMWMLSGRGGMTADTHVVNTNDQPLRGAACVHAFRPCRLALVFS